jgi:radical SAM protein with 4Fe4S-binding SPASM domain
VVETHPGRPQKEGVPPLDFSRAPIVVFWELTRACALACKHCRAQAQPSYHPLELSTEEALSTVDEIARFEPKPILVLTGGDPLMRRDVFDIASQGVAHGLRVSLSPSVTALCNPRNLHRAYEHGIRHISISLDGAGEQVHDEFRGVPGSHQRTLQAVADAHEAGLSVQINTTVCRSNAAELQSLADLVGGLGVAMWDLFFLVPTGRARLEDMLSPQEHEDVFLWLYDLQKTAPYRVKTTLGQPFRRVASQRAQEEGVPFATPPATNDGKGICFISHIGQICPSGFLPIVCGNVRIVSLVETYQTHPVFQALRDPLRLQGKCGVCPFNRLCGGCRARAYACSGDYLAAEPACPYVPTGNTSEHLRLDKGPSG